MELNIGDIIEVIGWVMMKGLDSGQKYKVVRISKYFGKDVYWFSKARGKKEVCGHFVSDVDLWVNVGMVNNNRIDVIRRSMQI